MGSKRNSHRFKAFFSSKACTVVEQMPHHPKVNGSSPGEKGFQSLIDNQNAQVNEIKNETKKASQHLI
jgi:hypothetical protein